MPNKVGTIIESIDGGKPVDFANHDGINGNAGGTGDIPITDFGADRIIEPTTYRIPEPPGTGRRSRSGKPDGRTRAGRAARATDAGTPAAASESNLASVLSLKDLLLTVHMSASMLLKVEELALEIDEADKLAKAIEDLAKFYPVAIDPKKIAWANLGITAAQIYGTRIMAYRLRMANEKATRVPTPKPTPITDVPRTNGAPQPITAEPVYNPSDIWPEGAENY